MHWFSVDLGLYLGIIVNVFLIILVFAHAPCKTFKIDYPYNECAFVTNHSENHVFAIQKATVVHDFPDLFRYQFFHSLLKKLGMDISFMLVPLLLTVSIFFDVVV